ncbi:hypothetical protein [Bradymonas sediminis]|uniref:Uncharacterized protein n=1 Tax=Bradymonas sediminis TaxID=1548548 RepID=A0A2Z4FL21_9DELT|nr:hypothetical protein [Bradymonas sediminis]AWV89697.1 hypothetical protein DN745_10235 [Bradymonas sediminis]TDP76562.1 hypothetical protein DFR33_102193 [Bradymonas sediminis]
MSTQMTLRNESIFDRHLVALVGGGLVAGVVSGVLGLVIGEQLPQMGALSFAAVVGLAINQADPREDSALVRLIFALIGGVLMGLILPLGFAGAPLVAAAVGGGFIGAAVTFDRQESTVRKWLGIALFALALPAGVFSSGVLFPESALQFLEPVFGRQALIGATWGVFMAVAAGLSDLRPENDAQLALLDRAIAEHQQPVRDYLESARELHQQVLRESERSQSADARRRAGEIARETIDSLLRFAQRSRELRAALQATGSERLTRRINRLNQRIAATTNPAIARELTQARDDAREQAQMRERLDLACVRLETRQQRCVTTLEKLHLTLVQHSSHAVSDLGLTESLAQLEQFADEVQFQNLSVDELCEDEQEYEAIAAPEPQVAQEEVEEEVKQQEAAQAPVK